MLIVVVIIIVIITIILIAINDSGIFVSIAMHNDNRIFRRTAHNECSSHKMKRTSRQSTNAYSLS